MNNFIRVTKLIFADKILSFEVLIPIMNIKEILSASHWEQDYKEYSVISMNNNDKIAVKQTINEIENIINKCITSK